MPPKARKSAKRCRAETQKSPRRAADQLSPELVRRLVEIAEEMKRNIPIVEARLRAAGITLDPVYVSTLARYLSVLDRLAEE